ncbi:hypothetical protein HDU76_008468 [Blyttiomyces sp. JEL0837]|nr:hypothetical protein HDU76_008468 [Blyttiomyces sp. JEL0837]
MHAIHNSPDVDHVDEWHLGLGRSFLLLLTDCQILRNAFPNLPIPIDPIHCCYSSKPSSLFIGCDGNGNILNIISTIYSPNEPPDDPLNLSGPLPASLGNITTLLSLILEYNQITGPIPDSLANLVNLEYLSLRGNSISNTIPDIFGNMPNLLEIDLSYNELRGPLPQSLETCSKLRYIYLEANHLNGSIPRAILELPDLQELDISANRIKLPDLQELDISANRISGSLPPDVKSSEWLNAFFELGSQWRDCSLFDQQSQDCQSLIQAFPTYFVDTKTCCERSDLVTCDSNNDRILKITMSSQNIDNNRRSPAVKLAKLSELTYLDLSSNPHGALGTQMQSLFNCTKLQYLDIHSTGTSVALTPQFGKLTNLEYVDMSDNILRGVNLGDWIGNVQKLRYLDLSWPKRTLGCRRPAYISEEIGKLKDLRIFNITNVCVKGTIPNSIGNLTSLEYLDFSKNQMHGPLPPSLGNLKKLTTLNLRQNSFESFIPEELGGLENVRVMLLPRNNLVGQLPPALGNLGALQILDLSNNNFNGSLPMSMGDLRNLQYLDVSGNRIGGSVPPSFNQLTHLEAL